MHLERGRVRFVDGAAAEGAYLTPHEGIDTVHATGSERGSQPPHRHPGALVRRGSALPGGAGPRGDYYPGAAGRLRDAVEAHPGAEFLAGEACGALVSDITRPDAPMLTDEVFADALGVVRPDGRGPAAFLRAATVCANGTLPGTLGATLLVHPRTEREPARRWTPPSPNCATAPSASTARAARLSRVRV